MADGATIGTRGEEIARGYLERSGYLILHINWRSGSREVDIIASKDDLLVFVEVKTRSYTTVMEPSKAVTRSKQKLLIGAAQHYVEKHQSEQELRFDIITVVHSKEGPQIEHIPGAYHAYAR